MNPTNTRTVIVVLPNGVTRVRTLTEEQAAVIASALFAASENATNSSDDRILSNAAYLFGSDANIVTSEPEPRAL